MLYCTTVLIIRSIHNGDVLQKKKNTQEGLFPELNQGRVVENPIIAIDFTSSV